MLQQLTSIILLLLLAGTFTHRTAVDADAEKRLPKLDPLTEQEQRFLEQLAGLKRDHPELPTVLILGDSISIGYFQPVREMLAGQANVIHNPGNAQGTTHTLAHLDRWLSSEKWDVIHFNLGLHDLKRVKVAGTSMNSKDPNDPCQADLATYTANLKVIVKKLKATGARLIFATTTPFPEGADGPLRDPDDVNTYNDAAVRIMKDNGIAINDLHGFALPQLQTYQQPHNVHFTKHGSNELATAVHRHVSQALRE